MEQHPAIGAFFAYQPYVWLSLAIKQQLTTCACSIIAKHAQIISCCSMTNDNHAYPGNGVGAFGTRGAVGKSMDPWVRITGSMAKDMLHDKRKLKQNDVRCILVKKSTVCVPTDC